MGWYLDPLKFCNLLSFELFNEDQKNFGSEFE